MGCMCNKCSKMSGFVVLLVGVGFLLADWGKWNFWGLNWWTVIFLLWGLVHVGKSCCKDCQAACSCSAPEPTKKKR